MNMKLVVGVDSTWSLRVWICTRMIGLAPPEIVISLGEPGYHEQLLQYSDTKLVPVFMHDDLTVHDSLAITEYLNELSKGRLYPVNMDERAHARSLCAEMHSGFMQVRSQCPFTSESTAVVKVTSSMVPEINRIESIFSKAQSNFMFSIPTAVDAFYAILAFRLARYGIYFEGKAGEYQQALLAWPLLKQAIEQAKHWKIQGAKG